MASLRQLLYKFVPKELIERPKMGFGVEALLSEHRLKTAGIFVEVGESFSSLSF
jgi:hypothetical protein